MKRAETVDEFVAYLLDRVEVNENECWLWRLGINAHGYGRVNDAMARRFDVSSYAHRALFQLLVERPAAGFHLDHLCRVPRCCNPAHLEIVTCAENQWRSPISVTRANALKTHCIAGHPYDEENTYLPPRGKAKRACRACHRDRERARLSRSRSAA